MWHINVVHIEFRALLNQNSVFSLNFGKLAGWLWIPDSPPLAWRENLFKRNIFLMTRANEISNRLGEIAWLEMSKLPDHREKASIQP